MNNSENKLKNLYILELSEIYDNQVRLPYSTGVIWSYCKTHLDIKLNYNLNWFFYKQDPQKIIDQIIDPDIIIFSSFVWNWNHNKVIAKKIKEIYPDTVIVFGGAMVPSPESFSEESINPYWEIEMKDWFNHYSYIDIISIGEGELTICDILIENLRDKNFDSIPGCITKKCNYQYRDRIVDIDSMPSPYLDGTFDKLLENFGELIPTATIESVRGCPYSCTFCEIGDSYYDKIKKQSLKKLFKEIEWIAQHKIEYIVNVDSNFGLFYDRDMKIANFLLECNKKYEYPKTYKCDWVKAKSIECINIAKILYQSKLYKGMTLAFQSLDEDTSKSIHRKNISDEKLKSILELYKNENMPVYIELILGLPSESKESFIDGLYKLMEYGHHDYVSINPLEVFPNTPFSNLDYIKKYGLKISKTMPQAVHYKFNNNLDMKTRIVVGSNNMSYEDYISASLYRWLLISCHFFGPTQFIAKHFGDYRKFYNGLYDWAKNNSNTILGLEFKLTEENLRKTTTDKNHPWGRVIPELWDCAWEYEEVTNYFIFKNQNLFYSQLSQYRNIPKDVLTHQLQSVVNPNLDYGGNYFLWMRDCLWWGRRDSKYLKNNTKYEIS